VRSPVRILWVVAGVLALALAALVLVELVRGDDKPRGSDEAAYIDDVNRLQGLSAGKLAQLNDAYADFGTAKGGTPAHVKRLRDGERALRQTRADVAAVETPERAQTLRRQLLRLLDLEIAFAHDVTLFAQYLPKAGAGERSAEAARNRLVAALPAADDAATQARAFDAYAAGADAAAAKLARLRAPAEFDLARKAEVARLRKLSTLASDAAGELRNGSRAGIEKAVNTFATESSSSVVVLRQREAALAYNRRLDAIEAQRRRLERAEAKLQRSL
jgi:hypothetical protein